MLICEAFRGSRRHDGFILILFMSLRNKSGFGFVGPSCISSIIGGIVLLLVGAVMGFCSIVFRIGFLECDLATVRVSGAA